MSCNRALNIKNVPMNATWEIEEAFCVSVKDLTVDDLAGKYFLFYNDAGTKYKAWFYDGVATEPTVASTTAIAIDISAATSAANIATALKTDIDATAAAKYTGTISNSTTVKFVYDDTSKVSAPENGNAGALIELTRVQIGGSIDLGLLDGDVTLDPTVDSTDITAHQTGTSIIGQTVTNVGAKISLTLKEYSPSKYRDLFEALGGKVSTTSVTGFGSSLVGTNKILTAKRLVLHPVKNAAADLTEDYTVWKAVPELGSITFSGEKPNTLPLDFTAYIDDDKDSKINVFAFGDITTLP